MIDFDRIRSVKAAAQARLTAIPGVHAVAIGAKKVGGERTAEPAIIVYLVRKKSPHEIPEDELIPPEINGVKTDVIEEDIPKLHAENAEGGLEIQVGRSLLQELQIAGSSGTLGCIAISKDKTKVYAVTCHHVVAPDERGASGLTSSGKADPDPTLRDITFTFGGAIVAGSFVYVNFSPLIDDVLVALPVTLSDTLLSITAGIAKEINHHPHMTAVTDLAGSVTINPGADFFVHCTIGGPGSPPLTVTLTEGPLPNDFTLTFAGEITAASAVLVTVTRGPKYGAFYQLRGSDTLDKVATGIAKAVADLGVRKFSAVQSSTSVKIDPGPDYQCICIIDGPTESSCNLKVLLADSQITFRGEVSGDSYGVFTNVNVEGILPSGGLIPSYGIFTPLPKATSLDKVAQMVSESINSMAITYTSGTGSPKSVSATSAGAIVTVLNAAEFDCQSTDDVRVGQPCFCCDCSVCCGHRIGLVAAARLDVDAALIQLDPQVLGLFGSRHAGYLAEISRIGGFVTGSYSVTEADIVPGPFKVMKSGMTSGLTSGTVTALNRDGIIKSHDGSFSRQYAGAMLVESVTSKPFIAPGDSGSAVVHDLNGFGQLQVVGIAFGGDGLATPIKSITDLFNIDVATATAAGQVQLVPQTASAHAQVQVPLGRPIAGAVPIAKHLGEVQREITATEAGREYAEVVRRHAPEVQTLINTNRRVATVWHRNGGPQMIQALLRLLHRRDLAIPTEIHGKPLAVCIERIQKVLMRYASPDLAKGLCQYAPRLASVGGLTYAELLAGLRSPQAEQ